MDEYYIILDVEQKRLTETALTNIPRVYSESQGPFYYLVHCITNQIQYQRVQHRVLSNLEEHSNHVMFIFLIPQYLSWLFRWFSPDYQGIFRNSAL